jgi:hypothetical protein
MCGINECVSGENSPELRDKVLTLEKRVFCLHLSIGSRREVFSRRRFQGALHSSEEVLGTNEPDDAFIRKFVASSVKKEHFRDAGHPELLTKAFRLG